MFSSAQGRMQPALQVQVVLTTLWRMSFKLMCRSWVPVEYPVTPGRGQISGSQILPAIELCC